ncbi:MAG: ubiquinol oxidase subunit II, cyanide insensitive [marine bacterium B5-7]|nr:MAG: ubiquinol oxidase subunit II, cyanide insensitive [marine bacterium B5-7]
MDIDLPLVWAGLISFAVLAYVILDGFDLGLGILFLLMPDHKSRDLAMNSVAPVWDGNETWLVLGGGGLFAAFPLAYATILPALYAPLIAMLLGLVFRGVSFEFRAKAGRSRILWDIGFSGGSLIAALAQGIALGTIVQGINVEGRSYAGGWWDWLTPFSLLTGVALVVGYGLLGATWLIMKTDGDLNRFATRFARLTATGTLALIGLVSIATPFLNPIYLQRWFVWPGMLFSFVVPLLIIGCALSLYRCLSLGRVWQPFVIALALFILCYIGILISFYPYIVPPDIDIWQAAAPDSSLEFLLVGALILIPVILAYTGYAYWVFRGKVDPDEGYH